MNWKIYYFYLKYFFGFCHENIAQFMIKEFEYFKRHLAYRKDFRDKIELR